MGASLLLHNEVQAITVEGHLPFEPYHLVALHKYKKIQEVKINVQEIGSVFFLTRKGLRAST
jgi:hypothetical protein